MHHGFMMHHIPGNTKSCSPCVHAGSLVDDQWMDGSIADVHGWPTAPSIGPTILFYAHFGSWASVSMLLHDDSAGSSDEEDWSGGEVEAQDSPRTNEDHELKDKLLRRYSGYISTLKREFTKKKKNGKLPREARQILFDWWNLHYKWPYPTEADKISLAQVTRLDQKQINNWFINQRKRHWKPTENMQYAVMDSLYGPCSTKD